MFRLAELVPPDPMPDGSGRPATPADLDLLMEWVQAFQDEVEPRGTAPSRPMQQRRVELELVWFWLDAEGDPVSLAGRNVTIAGVSRVAPVYTPPEHRGHGYGAAATAACTRHALDTGAEQVVLFTDAKNPTSNRMYQRLGYRRVGDRLVMRYR
jgi:predicted GNAT family acetyltransferase